MSDGNLTIWCAAAALFGALACGSDDEDRDGSATGGSQSQSGGQSASTSGGSSNASGGTTGGTSASGGSGGTTSGTGGTSASGGSGGTTSGTGGTAGSSSTCSSELAKTACQGDDYCEWSDEETCESGHCSCNSGTWDCAETTLTGCGQCPGFTEISCGDACEGDLKCLCGCGAGGNFVSCSCSDGKWTCSGC